MSHIVSITTKLRDPAAIAAACQRLRLAAPEHGSFQLFAGQEATGWAVRLPDWRYPAVIDTATGVVPNVRHIGSHMPNRLIEQYHLRLQHSPITGGRRFFDNLSGRSA